MLTNINKKFSRLTHAAETFWVSLKVLKRSTLRRRLELKLTASIRKHIFAYERVTHQCVPTAPLKKKNLKKSFWGFAWWRGALIEAHRPHTSSVVVGNQRKRGVNSEKPASCLIPKPIVACFFVMKKHKQVVLRFNHGVFVCCREFRLSAFKTCLRKGWRTNVWGYF